MAKGKHKSNKHSRGKHKTSKVSRKTKNLKNETWRDIKHSALIRQFRKNLNENKEVEKLVSSDEETEQEIMLDPLTELMSTFQVPDNKDDAIDSDEEEYEDEETSNVSEESDHGFVKARDVEEENVDNVGIDNYDDNDSEKSDDGDTKSELDPFVKHFMYDLHDTFLDNLSKNPVEKKIQTLHWEKLPSLTVEIPLCTSENTGEPNTKKTKLSIVEEKEFASSGTVPECIKSINWENLFVKTQIARNIAKANAKRIELELGTKCETLTLLQKELFSCVNNYQDLLYCERIHQNEDEIMFVYCLHVLNHMLKTRHKILLHNEKLLKKSADAMSDEFRDQGLVRPKVLILVPFRDSCLRIVNTLIKILFAEEKSNVINRTRFNEEFSGSELHLPKKNPKPEDYESLFKGNIDDTFKIGLSITKKSIKLYTDFYSSDIIIASPLGLRLVIGAEGEKERDYDFLASIEVLILDQVEVFFMQNWEHLLHVFEHLHMQPKDTHGTHISRIRSWTLNGWSKYYRQTLMFSTIIFPDLVALYNRRCLNYSGRIVVKRKIECGTISQVLVQLPQVFHKFKASSVSESIDERFNVFVNRILPQFKDSLMRGVVIYIPSYFDFVRFRNYMKKEELNFSQICEYSKDNKVARARDMFYHDQVHFLLYSERFHFFRRIRLKGIRHLIFYQPPTIPHFYSEMCNLMHESCQNRFVNKGMNLTVTVLYCKYDVHQLSAIVNTTRAARMITSDKNVHMFTSKQ